MLKIKDNADLKELGFEKDKEDFIYQDDIGLCVEENRVIWFGNFSDFTLNQNKHLDRLYDLIKARIGGKGGGVENERRRDN